MTVIGHGRCTTGLAVRCSVEGRFALGHRFREVPFFSQVDHRDSIGQWAMGDSSESNPFQHGRQLTGQRKGADGLGEIGVGLPRPSQNLTDNGHDVEGIEVIEASEPGGCGFGRIPGT